MHKNTSKGREEDISDIRRRSNGGIRRMAMAPLLFLLRTSMVWMRVGSVVWDMLRVPTAAVVLVLLRRYP